MTELNTFLGIPRSDPIPIPGTEKIDDFGHVYPNLDNIYAGPKTIVPIKIEPNLVFKFNQDLKLGKK